MFSKPQFLFALYFVTIPVACSEFEIFDEEPFSPTFTSFWNKPIPHEGKEFIYLSAPVRLIDHQLGLLGRNRENRRERLVPKQVGGYPGAPVVCYYCNVWWGTAGYYPPTAGDAPPTSCSGDKVKCGNDGDKPCCPPYECDLNDANKEDIEEICQIVEKDCREDTDCPTGLGCVDKKCKICLRLGVDCPGKSPCCQGSCFGGTCELSQCSRKNGVCAGYSKQRCCTGFACRLGGHGGHYCQCRDAEHSCDPDFGLYCCKGNTCVGQDSSSGSSGVCEPKPCTKATASKVCGEGQLCINKKCVNPCIKRSKPCKSSGDPRPCCGSDKCINSVCKHKCITIGQNCKSSGDNRPCCAGDGCIDNVCEPSGCRLNKSRCKASKDCCWNKSSCKNGRCDGCLEVDEDVAVDPTGCKKNSDCCRNGECNNAGGALKGKCFNNPKTCDQYGKGCQFNSIIGKNNCCRGLTCRQVSPTSKICDTLSPH